MKSQVLHTVWCDLKLNWNWIWNLSLQTCWSQKMNFSCNSWSKFQSDRANEESVEYGLLSWLMVTRASYKTNLHSRECCTLASPCRPQSTVRRHGPVGDWCKSDFSIVLRHHTACCTRPIVRTHSNLRRLERFVEQFRNSGLGLLSPHPSPSWSGADLACSVAIRWNLLGHGSTLQPWLSRSGPTHSAPPLLGGGLVQDRTRSCSPPPHCLLHSPQFPNSVQPPSTGNDHIRWFPDARVYIISPAHTMDIVSRSQRAEFIAIFPIVFEIPDPIVDSTCLEDLLDYLRSPARNFPWQQNVNPMEYPHTFPL